MVSARRIGGWEVKIPFCGVGVHEPEVLADRHPGLRQQGPHRVVALVVVLGEPDLGREGGDVDGTGALLGQLADLPQRVVDVDEGHLVRGHQPGAVDRGEVEHHLVEGVGGLPPPLAHQRVVPEGRDLAVEHLRGDVVTVHRLDPGVRLPVARVPHRLGAEAGGEDLRVQPPHLLEVERRLLGHGVVPGGVEPGGEVRLDLVGRDPNVRVHRDQPDGHLNPLRHRGAVS
jgi:hypothetical protein